jgi:hypothetical protein
LAFYRNFKSRAVFLILVWLLLLSTSLFLLSALLTTYIGTPQVQSVISLTWSGYVAASDFSNPQPLIISVNASWIVPSVNTSTGNAYSSAWVGIGGQFDSSLIQLGTEHDSVDGAERFSAWYELLPAFAVPIPMNISEGDMITASINMLNDESDLWLLQLTDLTNGETFCKNVNYNSTHLSAEWIVERPTLNGQISSLSNFGNITFTDAYVNINHNVLPLNESIFSQVHMTDHQNNQLTTVTKIDSDGTGFTVQYIAAG